MDLISRQAAIDAILHNQEVYSNNFGDDPIDKYTIAIIDNDAQTIAQLPSVQPEPRWIPCERELPAVGRSVLISVGGIYTAEGCLRDDGDWTQFRWNAIQRKDMVGAWRPLPEPYKGEQT